MNYIYLGKIVNTHGLKGEIRLLSDFKYKTRILKPNFSIYIGKNKEQQVINSYRHHKIFEMLTLRGIDNINDVLKYKGEKVYFNRDDLKLGKGEYLDEDLINLDVKVKGVIVGKIVKLEKGLQDKLIVNKNGINYRIPFVRDIIEEINLDEGFISVIYIKGLLD